MRLNALGCSLILGLLGCPDTAPPEKATDSDTGALDTADGEPSCGTAEGSLPEGLTEIAWDDGDGSKNITDVNWVIVDVAIADAHAFEATRFDLEHPARIHAIQVQYGVLPEDPDAAIELGLYPDFGYNGFDFWRFDPIWSGDRCRSDLTEGEWATYVLDEPWVVDNPGLVYVAHERENVADTAWAFDISAAPGGDCNPFDNCHSAINLPDVDRWSDGSSTYVFWNGYSFALQYDYLVRLYVEYTDDIDPDDRRFKRDEDVTLSTRVSFGDYDNDGDPDLFTNGPRLYRNDDGTMVDATDETGLASMGIPASGGVWGDHNNDGCLDLFIFSDTHSYGDTLLQSNCDGTFEDVTVKSLIDDIQDYNDCSGAGTVNAPNGGAAWVDYDGDGWLDLYQANFQCWDNYAEYADTVWRNLGDGTFEEITGLHGFRGFDDIKTASRGVLPVDIEQDGDVDVWVNNYVLQRNLFYDNQGDGTVVEASTARGLGGRPTAMGGTTTYYGHTIGTAVGDLDLDGDFDAIAANLAHPRFWDFSDKTEVLLQADDGTFEDKQGDWTEPKGGAGLRYSETHSVPVLGDFDLDGTLDLIITATYDGRPTDFYWGNGDGTFTLDTYTTGIDLEGGWGIAVADIDGDGDLDVATNGGLYRNEGTAEGHWLSVRVTGGTGGNAAGIGTVVRLFTTTGERVAFVSGGNGQGGQDDPVAHFGLGDITEITRLTVLWPGGHTVTVEGPITSDQQIRVNMSGEWTSETDG